MSETHSGLHSTVLNTIGAEITSGLLAEGEILSVEAVRERFGVSRTVVREALRSLESLGMVRARSKVGTKVTGETDWVLLNPMVIRWRASSHYREQMIQLLEVRRGVEASAARLCAGRMTEQESSMLVALSEQLADAAESRDGEQFLDVDARFHRLLLEGSGNPVIAQFADVVAAALRTRQGANQPVIIETTAAGLRLHQQLAEAIARRDPDAAALHAESIADLTLSEFR